MKIVSSSENPLISKFATASVPHFMSCTYSSLRLSQGSSISKTPFIAISSTIRNTSTLAIDKDAQFRQSPPIVHKLLSLLQDFSTSVKSVQSIHAHIVVLGLRLDGFVATKLVKIYGNLGCFGTARNVFDQIPEPRTFLWNTMIDGYVRNERYKECIELYKLMKSNGIETDSSSCTFALKACASLMDFEVGKEVMRDAESNGLGSDQYFGSSAISFLVKFGCVDEARRLFDGLVRRDIVCWNSIIGGYVQVGRFDEAFDLFLKMCSLGIRPTPVTMVSLIQACEGTGWVELGRCILGYVNTIGMVGDVMISTALIDMYGKLGDTGSARLVFHHAPMKNLATWNAMISACIHNGLVDEAFNLLPGLISSGNRFDSATAASFLQGCAQISSLGKGKVLHGCVLRRGLESNVFVATAIVDLYIKCNALKQASIVFKLMKERNVVSWSAMLIGLAQNGHAEEALELFGQMQEEGVTANAVTLVSLVHACAHMGSLKKGRSIHAYLIRNNFESNEVVATALTNMYAKCGKIDSSEKLFHSGSVTGDVVLWNSMITSYGIHGHGLKAASIYNRMKDAGAKPNQATFVSLLSACSHSGLVEEGINLFHKMSEEHCIMPNEKHYACLVDLLSRAGRLEEADRVIKQMPFEPGNAVLEALLSGCMINKNIDLGIKTADKLLNLDNMNPGIYVVLSNIYAKGGKWKEMYYIRGIMKQRGLKKTPGYSLIEVENRLHTFFAGDNSHPSWARIGQALENLRMEIEACGYIADTSCVAQCG
ncbi:hypothetical protein Sjap_006754 [Stephania japonica]|uniref:Chlororespiratory reduction 21 n=1 Tax=Stephania japonica TaxID=461633 RepID=A0AAP0K6E9_9MAGN